MTYAAFNFQRNCRDLIRLLHFQMRKKYYRSEEFCSLTKATKSLQIALRKPHFSQFKPCHLVLVLMIQMTESAFLVLFG